jgi:methionyl-tRNA formyltransferase
MNQKGLAVLEASVRELGPERIELVVGSRDANVRQDFYGEIEALCRRCNIHFLDRSEAAGISPDCAFAIGWRWLIRDHKQLIVFHDSLLPRYRGFSPLTSALINGDEAVGVTALLASDEYDRGDIIAQERLPVRYPVKIQGVIESLTDLYAKMAVQIAQAILSGKPLVTYPQDETAVTYSPWRDEEDYRINWSLDAETIKRFVDSVGHPYKGASSLLGGSLVRILDASVTSDVRIEQRAPGKVMFLSDGLPTVACGTGLLTLLDVRNDTDLMSVLPLSKIRSRFR